MLCKNCRNPITKVIAATYNPTEPRGPRPYHRICGLCPPCPHTQNSKTAEENWKTYSSPEEANKAGHARPCEHCIEQE